VYAGLQTKILERSSNAFYVPCTNHSLNLVGYNAAESCRSSLCFFDLVQKLYTYFTASTHRWDVLASHNKPKQQVIKQLSDTSARDDAVSALKKDYTEIQNSLLNISASEIEKPVAKAEAMGLAKKLASYEMTIMTLVWSLLIERLNKTSKCLQTEESNLKIAINMLESLKQYVFDVREDFSAINSDAKSLLTSVKILCKEDDIKRIKKRKIFDDDTPASTDNEVILQENVVK
jgi:hypothetical protein